MKRLILAFLILAGSASADVVVNATVPTANVARAGELCEELRLRLHATDVVWDIHECGKQVVRLGLLELERQSTKASYQQTVNQAVREAANTFASTWPPTQRADCRDGILSTEYNEACDDGDEVDGNDCTNSCELAVCGDNIVWDSGTGTETCDDGNTQDGDGCDASCIIEP